MCHWIKKNERSETPQRVVSIALEQSVDDSVDGQIHSNWQSGYAIYSKRNRDTGEWDSVPALLRGNNDVWTVLESLAEEKTKTYVVLENSWKTIQQLDLFVRAMERYWTMTFCVIDCPPMIVRLRRDKSTLLFLDIQNVWQTRLSDTSIGASLHNQSKKSANSELSSEHCIAESRVQIMHSQILDWMDFLRDHDLGGFSPTIGAQSFRVWRHKYMTHKVLIDLHDDACALARRGLFGGRAECGWIGKFEGQFYQLDINSSYASVMRTMRVPVQLVWHTKVCSISDLHTWMQKCVLVADVTVYTGTPCLPVRGETGLMFANGSFRTVLCGEELEWAVCNATIVKIHEAACYRSEYAFYSYMSDMWRLRQEKLEIGDHDEEQKYKMLMNSFFGKWAQQGTYWEKVADANDMSTFVWTEIDYETKETREFRQFGGIIQEKSREKESSESSPAIASCITAAARLRLWEYIQQAGMEHVFYVDTDSLLVDAVGLGRVSEHIDARELGALKLVGAYDSIEIRGCKDYIVGNKRVHAGVSKDAVYDSAGNAHQFSRNSLAAVSGADGNGSAVSKKVVKHFKHVYSKGIVGSDGKVRPVYL